jgi:hypothetical protein
VEKNITWVEITKIEQLISILPQWERLIKTQTTYTVFSSISWLNSWLETFWQNDWQLNVLIAWCEDELVAIVPIYYQQDNTLLPIKIFYPLGQGEVEAQEVSTEYIEIIFDKKFQNYTLPRIQLWLLNLKADQIKWHALLHNSPIKSMLEKHKQSIPLQATRYCVDCSNWSIDKLSKNMRSRYRRGFNQLDKLNGEMIWVKQSDFDLYWTKMKLFHQHRWQEKNKKGAFCSDEFNKFHTKFRNKSPKNVAMSAILINNSPIAIHYYFSDATTLYFYQSGWDEAEYSHLSPGMLLHLWSIKNNHKTYYDFMMGKKHDSYKAKFGTIQEPMYNITITFSPIKLLIHRILKKMKLYRL